MNNKRSIQIYIIGLFLSSFSILGSTLLGFGGFSIKAFNEYVIIGYVSRLEIIFLFLTGLGFIISGLTNPVQINNTFKESKLMFVFSYLTVGIIFIALAIFGGTSHLISSNFWANTTFKNIQNILIFNNLTLVCFLAIGTLQLFLLFKFFNKKFFKQNQILKATKILTLVSAILWIIKSIIDYPLIKEAIFVLSYELKLPLINNILSILAPIIYLSSQMFATLILSRFKNF